MNILEDWSKWMKIDNHKLGYPSKTSYLSTGGESTVDAFENMVEKADEEAIKILDVCIDGLPNNQRQAIYCRWLGGKKYMYYERDLNLAMDNLLTIVGRRIYA